MGPVEAEGPADVEDVKEDAKEDAAATSSDLIQKLLEQRMPSLLAVGPEFKIECTIIESVIGPKADMRPD